jgi:hypothetical protein
MDHEVFDCPRMIAKVEKMNMKQENYETSQETKDMIEPQKESEIYYETSQETITYALVVLLFSCIITLLNLALNYCLMFD